ncbi:MAG: DNA mismatch repair protein MutS, partial [Rhabdochlamydiaceae bacterium]
VEKYLAKLLAQGIRVALCDQLEDPRLTKKLVKRGITRVLTPGTVLDDSMLPASANNYLCAVAEHKGTIGLAILDAGTGEFAGTEFTGGDANESLSQEFARLRPSEVLAPVELQFVQQLTKALNASISVRSFPSITEAERLLNQQFGSKFLGGFGLDHQPATLLAAGAIMDYARSIQLALDHVSLIQTYDISKTMRIDPATRKALELTQAMSGGRGMSEGRSELTLLKTLDFTLTPMGKRTLTKWIDQPLLDRTTIEARLEAVERLIRYPVARAGLRDALKGLGDLERPVSRCCTGTATPLDLGAVRRILLTLPKLDDPLRLVSLGRIQELREDIGNHTDLAQKLRKGLAESPSSQIREGNVIREGFDSELDNTRKLSRDAKEFMASLETKERSTTGISGLKIGYNSVFGYYLEVPKRFVAEVPSHYVRKQTTANAERYITTDLKEQESIVLSAADRAISLEADLFAGLRSEVAACAEALQKTANALGQVDTLASLAEAAVQRRYVRPEILEVDCLEIEHGRHPIVEVNNDAFVPNGIHLD